MKKVKGNTCMAMTKITPPMLKMSIGPRDAPVMAWSMRLK